IDLAACQQTGPWLTLIMPDEAANERGEGLALVPADGEGAEAEGIAGDEARFDSSAFTSFNEWTEQVSGEFSAPADADQCKDDMRMKKLAAREVAAENLWSSLETSLHVVGASDSAEPRLATTECELVLAPSNVEVASDEPVTTAPPAPPERIGAGQ